MGSRYWWNGCLFTFNRRACGGRSGVCCRWCCKHEEHAAEKAAERNKPELPLKKPEA